MKNQNGVSLFEVIIAIIILLIIAFFALFNSRNSVGQALATDVYSEMKSVEAVVDFIGTNMVMDEDFALERGKHYDEKLETDTYIIYGIINGNVFDTAASNLGLENLKRDYIVNYKERKFELKDAVNIQGTSVKTLADVNDLINSGNL